MAQISWTEINTPATSALQDIQFGDEHTGFAYSADGEILRSQDEGLSWQVVYTTSAAGIWSLYVLDQDNVWASGPAEAFVHSSDGGNSWTDVNFPDLGGGVNEYDAVYFVDEMIGYVGVYNATLGTNQLRVYKTEDGGASWNNTNYDLGGFLFRNFEFVDEDQGWVCAYGAIAYTLDGGDTWTESFTGTAQDYVWLDLIDMSTVWVLCDSGEINWTTDMGGFWNFDYLDITSRYYEVEVLNDEFIYCVGTNANVWEYVTGTGWSPIFVSPENFIGAHIENESSIWLSASNGLVYRGQVTPNDVIFENLSVQDSVCINNTYPLDVTVKNQGLFPLSGIDFEIYENLILVNTVNWPGTLSPDGTETINLGTYKLNSATGIKVAMSGDSITWNNEVADFVYLHTEFPHGTAGTVQACPNEATELTAFGGVEYTWKDADPNGGDIVGEPITVRPQSGGFIYVDIKQQYCVYKDSIEILLVDCGQTTAFSPNGDNVNDYFHIEHIEGLDCDVHIYNSWGDEINYVEGYDNEASVWLGENKGGRIVPSGTYYYVVDFADPSIEPFSGWVQLLK